MEKLIEYIKKCINSVVKFKYTEYGLDWSCRFNHKLIRKSQLFANKVLNDFDIVTSFHVGYNVTDNDSGYWNKSIIITFNIDDSFNQVDRVIVKLIDSYYLKNLELKLIKIEYDEIHDRESDIVIQKLNNGDLKI